MKDDDLDPRVWKIAAVVLFGPLMSSLDATIVNVSLATLGIELHAGLTQIQWVTTAYLLTMALTLPMSGWVVDRIGAKRLYLGSFMAFTVASLLCGAAQTATGLVAARCLQGLAGGLLAPMAQMMIARSAGRHLPRVMGFMVIPILIGPILGPVVAGMILQHATWHWIFFINLPIGILATLLALIILPEDRDEVVRRPFDGLGFVLLAPALVGLLHGLEASASGSLSDLQGRLELLGATGLMVAFLAHARRRKERALINVHLLARPVFMAAASTQFLSNAAVYGSQMLTPLYLLTVCGQSPTRTGLALAPVGLGMLCSYPWMGFLTERFGPRRVSAAGALVGLLGTLPFAVLGAANITVVTLSALLFLRGVGMGCINIPSMSAAYGSVPRETLPTATTAINILQRLGGPVGTTLLTLFLHAQMQNAGQSQDHAFMLTFLMLSGFLALCVGTALRLPLRVPGHDAAKEALLEVES